jgi:hypothetical protein
MPSIDFVAIKRDTSTETRYARGARDIASNIPTSHLLATDYSDRDFANEEQSIDVASSGEMTYLQG